jgi:hypothetical protein
VGTSPESYKGKECLGNIRDTSLTDLIVRHLNLLPDILEWRFKKREIIKRAPLSLCNWCFLQFGKLDWLKEYQESPWARYLT